jgi:hypothetical protein
MPFEVTLPAELWLIILDMAIATGITLIEHCDHISFPDIYAYLLAVDPPIDNSYEQLRLVCRMFNALLGSSPQYIMKSPHGSIPTNARAVYITERVTPSEHIQRLLQEPLISHRLLYLDTFFNHSQLSDVPIEFDLLCENSRSLPNLRCITFRFLLAWENMDSRFWVLLNDAFPLLRRLVIMQYDDPGGFSAPSAEYDGDIMFQNVELLSVGSGICFISTLRFPRLRHVALDTYSKVQQEVLSLSPLLESAIFENVPYRTSIDLKLFPRLRLLGLQTSQASAILPVGDEHPLEHLWLYSLFIPHSQEEIPSIIQVAKLLPGVARVTVDTFRGVLPLLESELQRAELRSLGLSICPMLGDESRIVLKSTKMDSRIGYEPELVEQRPFLSWIRLRVRSKIRR